MDDIVKPNICPECRNTFMQPFVCTTCGAQKLYDTTLRNAVLRAEKAEHEIERLRAECEALRKMDDIVEQLRALEKREAGNCYSVNKAMLDAAAEIERLRAEREALRKDAERLDFVERSSKGYGLGWIFRESRTGRGMRLHETSEEGASASAREAIDRAMASGAEGGER